MPNSKLFSEVSNIEHLTATTAPLRGLWPVRRAGSGSKIPAADFHPVAKGQRRYERFPLCWHNFCAWWR
jgi:hypothetical protein